MTQGWQRVGAFSSVPEVLRGFGVNPDEVLAAAALDRRSIEDREHRIPFTSACSLVQISADRTGCAHFGLLVGQRNGSDSLGLVGRLMRHAPTWGEALLYLADNQHRYVRGSVAYLMVQADVAWAGYAVYQRNAIGVEHMEDGAIAVGFNLMRELCGTGPEAVWLARKAPADPQPYHSFFGVPVRFDSHQSALVFPRSLLDVPVKGADPRARSALEAQVRDYWALDKPKVSDHVVRLLRSRILFGAVNVGSVARALSMHPRVLERALAREETTFRTLQNETRADMAQRLLRGTRLSITEIATSLGYGDTSAFSNAFRRMTGASPSSWRNRATVKREYAGS